MLPIISQNWDTCLYQGIPTLNCIWIVIKNVVNFLLIFVGVIAVFMIVYSGVKYITAAGDKEKIASAQKTITFAIIGLVLVLLAFTIISFISYFTGVGIDQLTTQPSIN